MMLKDKVAVIYGAGGRSAPLSHMPLRLQGQAIYHRAQSDTGSKRSQRSFPPADPPRRRRSMPSTSRVWTSIFGP